MDFFLQTIGTNGYTQYATQMLENRQLIDELYKVLESDELTTEVSPSVLV